MIEEYDKFVSDLERLLRSREGYEVIAIVRGPGSLEMVFNNLDAVVRMGTLKAAYVMTEEQFKESMKAAVQTGEMRAMIGDAAETMQGKKRGVN